MRRLLLLAAVAVLGGTAGAARADNPQLIGTVGTGDAFSIGLSDANGSPVHHLDPGTYTLLVHDRSALHNFHLAGPGVDVATDIEGIGDQTFTITLSDGTYTFQCDPHSNVMSGVFTVGTVTAPAPAPTAQVTKVAGSVGPGKKISVSSTLSGSSAGVFQFTIADKSKTDNFHLTGPGVSKKTGVATTGKVTWKLTLKRGTYTYRSDAHPTLRGSFTISG